MTELDKVYLDEAKREAEKRENLFFTRNGIDEQIKTEARQVWLKFVEREKLVGNNFYHSPLSMRSFIVGYFLAKREAKP